MANLPKIQVSSPNMVGMGMYRSAALSTRRLAAEEGGAQIPLYLAFKNLLPYVIKHLGEVHVKPYHFQIFPISKHQPEENASNQAN